MNRDKNFLLMKMDKYRLYKVFYKIIININRFYLKYKQTLKLTMIRTMNNFQILLIKIICVNIVDVNMFQNQENIKDNVL